MEVLLAKCVFIPRDIINVDQKTIYYESPLRKLFCQRRNEKTTPLEAENPHSHSFFFVYNNPYSYRTGLIISILIVADKNIGIRHTRL